MPDWGITAGDTNVTIYVRLRDSTTGLAKTGLVYNSAGAVASYVLPAAARAAITLATQTVTGAHSDGGFVEVDATNCKGLYRLDLPDAAVASGDYSLISIEFDGIIEETVIVPLSNTPQTGDNYARIGAPAGASIAEDIGDVPTVAEFNARTLVAASYFDPATDTVANVTTVGTCTTNTDMRGTDSAALASVCTEARLAELAAANLPADVATIAGYIDTEVAAILVDTGTTIPGLIAALNDPTAAAIADAVWDEAQAGHVAAGSFGEIATEIAAILVDTNDLQTNQGNWLTATGFSTHTAANVRTEMDSNSTQLAAIVADTNELQTDDVPGLIAALNDVSQTDITGGAYSLDTDANGRIRIVDGTGVGELDTNAGLIAGIAGTKNTLDDLNDITTANVNSEVVDALNTDTYAEPGQGNPGATVSLAAKINYLYKAWRNKKTQTATTFSLFDDAGTTVDQKSTVSDDETTATIGEIVTGP